MAEEQNQNQQQGQQNDQQQGNNNNNPGGEVVLGPLQTLKMMGAQSEAVEKLEKVMGNNTQNQNQNQQQGNEQNQNQGEGSGQGKNEGAQNQNQSQQNGEGSENKNQDGKQEGKETKEPPKVNSVLGLGQNNNKGGSSQQALTIENPEQMLAHIKSAYGMEIKDLKEIPKFFESAQKWRNDSQKVGDLEKSVENWKEVFQALPENLFNAVKAFHEGKDYKSALQEPKFDFANKKATDYSVKDLVSNYFPGKFTDEDFKEQTKSPALEIAEQAAIEKFNSEKTNFDNQRAKYQENAKKQVELHKASVKSSVANLRQSFPNTEETALKEISSILEGGPQSVVSFFFNNDGTVKPESAEMLMMAKHGKSELHNAMILAAHMAETKTNEDIVSRGSDGPGVKNSGNQQSNVSPEVKKQIADLGNIRKARQKTF